MEADLLRHYRIDLHRDLGTERLTFRRLSVLLSHLPRDSSFVRAVAGEAARWGDLEHLVASVIDALQGTNYLLTAQAAGKRKVKVPRPIPRPGQAERRHAMTPAQLDVFFAERRRRQASAAERPAGEVT